VVASGVPITRAISSSTRGQYVEQPQPLAEQHRDLVDLQLIQHTGLQYTSPAGPGGRPDSPSAVASHSCSRPKPSPPGLPGPSFGPAMYPSSDIDM
jgi:hypothetical protein